MMDLKFREAKKSDIPILAAIRAAEWETEEYWIRRIAGYRNKLLNPQMARSSRIIYVATDADRIIGFIAGHLTKRLDCEGELQWINIIPAYRKKGIAAELIRLLAAWFVRKKALKICIDPGDQSSRLYYIKKGAENLNEHWLYWKDVRVVLDDHERSVNSQA